MARHANGIVRNLEISRKLAEVLATCKVPAKEFIRYNAFAQKLGCLSRKYSGKSLQMAMLDLVDLYEAKSLDGDVLAEIAHSLFDIPDLS